MGLTEEERQAVMKVVKLANNGDQKAQEIIDIIFDDEKRKKLLEKC